MIIAKAPGRAGIIGNPTDGYGGAMIACSIPYFATVKITPADKLRLVMGDKETVINWKSDLKLQGDRFDLARAVLQYYNLTDLKVRIEMESDIPRQAGMAGSTALLSAILAGVTEALGKKYSPYYFAELNRNIELRYMNTHCGYQDAYMTTFGGLNFLDFRGKEYYESLENEVYASVESLREQLQGSGQETFLKSTGHSLQTSSKELPFILAHTGVKHNSGDFHRPIRERWLEGEKEVVEGYKEITELAIKGKRALLDGNWKQLGKLMNKNHRIQDSLSFSGEQNNELIATALNNGALAAKLAGAGGGGTIIALTLKPEETGKALLKAGAEMILKLDPEAGGVQVGEISEKTKEEIAASGEEG